MSKIATYPSADTPLQLSDRLIGTEAVRPIPSKTPLATKNFSLGELLQLFSSEFPAATLQAVLNAGNIATQDITLIGTITSSLIIPTNIQDMLGSQGTTFQYLSKAVGGFNWVDLPVDGLQAVLDKSNTATQNIILVGDITSTKIIPGNIQDETSSIGTTGQVLKKTATGIEWGTGGGGSQNLQQVVDIGNTITYTSGSFVSTSNLTGVGIDIIATDIDNLLNYNVSYNVGGITLQSDGNIDPYQNGFSVIYPYGIDISDGLSNQAIIRPYYIYISEAATNKVCYIYPDNISFQNGVGNGTISSQLLTDAILFNLPNKPTGAYTLATTDDITSQSLQSVTDVGNITTNDIIVRHDGFTDIKISSQSGIDNNRIQLKNSLSKLILFCENNQSLIEFNDNRGVAYLRADQQLLSSTSSGKIIEIDAYSNIIKLGANGIIIFGDSGGSSTAQIKSDLITGVVYQQLPNQSGTFAMLSDIPSLTGYVPTSRTLTINGVGYDLTADRSWTTPAVPTKTSDLINDGDNGTSHFISLEDLPSNLTLYATNVASGISTYTKAVSSLTDPDYNAVAVNIPVGPLTSTTVATACGGIVSSANIIVGNPGIFTMSTIGSIRRTSGTAEGVFYYEVYKRTSAGVESLIVTSANTNPVSSAVYVEFNAAALFNNGVFTATDRVVIKFYGLRLSGGSNPSFEFQFGGVAPVRTTLPIPLVVTPANGVTSVAALTLGTTGTDLTSTVANGTTTPVITLNVPTASATNRGALSTTDWNTFNNKLSDASFQFTRRLIANGLGSVTGTTAETIITSLTIPANTLDSKCFIWSTMDYFKTNAGSCTLRFYVNSSNSLSGATQIGLATIASNRNLSFNRKLYLNGTILDFLLSTTTITQATNEFGEAIFGASTTVTVNPANDIFLIYTTTNDAVGTVTTAKQATVQKMKLN